MMEFQIDPLNNQKPPVSQPFPPKPTNQVDFVIPQPGDRSHKMNPKTKYLIACGLVIAVAAGVFLFLHRGTFSQNNVALAIDGPRESAAGELVTYKVRYGNNNQVPLTNAKLTFFYPEDGLAARDNDITPLNNSSVDLATIESGVAGEVEFQVYLVGDSGNLKTPRATLVFSVGGINSQFQKDATFSTTISSLSVPLTLAGPPTVQSGQTISYTLDYRNDSAEDKINLRLKLQYPDGFKFVSAVPPPNSGSDTWDIPFLKAGNDGRITINGSLNGNQGETKTLIAVLQRQVVAPDGTERYIDYEKTNTATTLSSAPLSVVVMLNNSQAYVAHLADRLEYVATVRNNSSYDLLTITLAAKLSGVMYDFATLQSKGFFDSRSNTISWDASTVPEFTDLRPGQAVTIPFTVTLKKNFTSGFGTKDAFVKAALHVETTNVPAVLDQAKLAGDSELVTRISTVPDFGQVLSIKDVTLGNGGPLPPKVNQKTVVFVHWTLINPANDVSGAKVTAVLAPGVVWENRTRTGSSQPQPTYNSKSNTVTWNLGTLPAGIGLAFPKYEAVFAVSLTPSVNQVGQAPAVLNNASFSGADSFTKEQILLNMRNMTTFDISDSDATKTVQP